MAKRTSAEIAQTLINEGTIIKVFGYTNPTYIVESHGHTYTIENAFSKKPKITQHKEKT